MNLHPEQPWSLRMVAPLEPGIVCMDLEKMFRFYTDVIGLRFATDAEAQPEMSTRFGTGPHGFRIIRLQTPYGERVKLIRPKKTELQQPPNPDWVFERQGIAYITFVVADVNEVVARLKAHKVDLVSDDAVNIREGINAIFVRDPEGNFLEFVQYDDLPAYRPDLFKWQQFF